jgi:site-specific recombinase XerD
MPWTRPRSLAGIQRAGRLLQKPGRLDPNVAAAIRSVRGPKAHGVRIGNWLSQASAEALYQAPDTRTHKGRRDQALLAILLGAGLGRNEAAGLMLAHIEQREGRWVIIDLVGKHRHVRSIPIASWTGGLSRLASRQVEYSARLTRRIASRARVWETIEPTGELKLTR